MNSTCFLTPAWVFKDDSLKYSKFLFNYSSIYLFNTGRYGAILSSIFSTFYLHLKYSVPFVALSSSWWPLHPLDHSCTFNYQMSKLSFLKIQLPYTMSLVFKWVERCPFSCLQLPSMAVNYDSFIAFLWHQRSCIADVLPHHITDHQIADYAVLFIDRRIWSLVIGQILFPYTIGVRHCTIC